MTIEYNNINIDADALVGSASIPSLTNVALGILKVCSHQPCTQHTGLAHTTAVHQCFLLLQRAVGLGGLKTSKLQVLKNVSGVLKPVSSVSDKTSAAGLAHHCILATNILQCCEDLQHVSLDALWFADNIIGHEMFDKHVRGILTVMLSIAL